MKYFRVIAQTTLPVYSDGTVDCDFEHAQDNITGYIVEEYDEDGCVTNTNEYDYEEFGHIADDYPASEWQNHDW